MKRVVYDANVLISAFLFRHSAPGRAVFEAPFERTVLTSADQVEELLRVLARPKLDAYIDLELRLDLLKTFLEVCVPIQVSGSIDACRDPRDNHVLELAVAGQANCVVSGDKDLLVLDPFEGVRILRPVDFLSL